MQVLQGFKVQASTIKSPGMKRLYNYINGRTEDNEEKGLAQQSLAAQVGMRAEDLVFRGPSGCSASESLRNGPSSELEKETGALLHPVLRLGLSPAH